MPEPMGFYTDTTVCIGCKACEVACKEWNQLPCTNGGVNTLSGDSYDNTRRLDGIHWRHVKFIEQFTEDRKDGRWLLMSDVCKHCVNAPCLEVCPTGAITRTEFDTVVIQSDACNGCRDCIAACPFGVIDINPRVCYFVQDEGKLAGILSGDEMRRVPEAQWDAVTARQAMVPSARLRAAAREQLISDVLLEMEIEDLFHMPVVENGRVVGVVARDRIVGLLRQAGLLPAQA